MNIYDIIYNIFLILYMIIFILGLIGNVLAFLVFSRKKFKNTLFSIYFRVLNIADIYTILFALVDFLKYKVGFEIEKISIFFCKTTFYSLFAVAPISGHILVVIGIDRFIQTRCPNRFSNRNKKNVQLCICFFIILYNILYYTPMIIFHEYELIAKNDSNNSSQESYVCYLNDDGISYWMDFFNSTVFPFALMIIFTSITIKIIFDSRVKLAATRRTRNRTSSIIQTNKIKVKDIKFAITCITLNVCFLILNFPVVTYSLLSVYISFNQDLDDFIYVITEFFFYVNAGLLFYINILLNSIFKNEFYKMLHSAQRNFF
jgi:hypothetical protein